MAVTLAPAVLGLALACSPAQIEAGHDAREYVVSGTDARIAEKAWTDLFDAGRPVVWTATLYDVDARSFFLVAFDRVGLRIYRLGEVAGAFETHLGVPVVPGRDNTRFWRAWGGCIDDDARPEAVVPWAEVREIKSGNWVLWFKLARTITVRSDRGKKEDIDEIKVNLHGGTATYEVHVTRDARDPDAWWKDDVRVFGIGPLAYNERVRFTLAKLVDPERRIKLPKASRSAGW
jgi:hypothetical protein